ncbi:uncharacterized protein LOC127241995 [Andrographis paniculata]|uniref:uncharacterized protein LOC127241995 n=1 Tax=Andrographis paniculata TaxID=175694 RepID=UPI0021E785DB|nr:uncharacterized protein LOC127241995 [Andrographis paniculata]
MLENITANEVAGYAVGALLLSATISAPKIDSFISASQRTSLGMCKRCGDLKLIACSKCKGSGFMKPTGGGRGREAFNLIPIIGDIKIKTKTKTKTKAKIPSKSESASGCSNCGGNGHFPCHECTGAS